MSGLIRNFITVSSKKQDEKRNIIPRMLLPLLLSTWKTAVRQSVMLMSRSPSRTLPLPQIKADCFGFLANKSACESLNSAFRMGES